MTAQILTHKQLKSMLHYSPARGVFTWRVSRRGIMAGTIAGTITHGGYVQIHIDGKTYLAHRLAFLYQDEKFPENEVDHINHIRDDNRLCNIRLSTHHENHKNLSLAKNNKSGVMGVFFDKSRNKWLSRIKLNQKTIHLGRFDKKEDAIKSRKIAESMHGFHRNHGQ